MIWFSVLILGFLAFSFTLLWQMWTHKTWDQNSALVRLALLILPWVPLGFVWLYGQVFSFSLIAFQSLMAITGLFGFFTSAINIYRTLWSALLRFQNNNWDSAGKLLLYITFVIVIAISALVALFAFGYGLATYLSKPNLHQYILHLHSGAPLSYREWEEFLYFSAVTYFSLGYGDYVPNGSAMLILVYLESLLGYINSGILIAYAFNLFNRLSITWGFWPKRKGSGRYKPKNPWG